MPLKMSFSGRVGTCLTVRWILSFMIPHPLPSSLFTGSTMDIKTVRGVVDRLKRFRVGRVIFVCEKRGESLLNQLDIKEPPLILET